MPKGASMTTQASGVPKMACIIAGELAVRNATTPVSARPDAM